MSHVKTVDTRDQSMSCFNGASAILCRDSRYTKIKALLSNALCVVSHVETVDTRDQSTSCFNGSNAMLCRYSRYKMHIHVSAHNFLNIQRIFNPQKSFGMLRTRAFQPYHQILYVDSVDRVDITSTLLH